MDAGPGRRRTGGSQGGASDAEVTTNGRGSWIVLLEAAPDGGASLLDIGTLRVILRAMGDEDGVALHAADRVAVQVHVEAPDVAVALCTALARWRTVAASVPPGWDVVRGEVLTPEEFARDAKSV